MTEQPEGVWIDYTPGDPVPTVPVRVRMDDGWESSGSLQACEYWPAPEGILNANAPARP